MDIDKDVLEGLTENAHRRFGAVRVGRGFELRPQCAQDHLMRQLAANEPIDLHGLCQPRSHMLGKLAEEAAKQKLLVVRQNAQI